MTTTTVDQRSTDPRLHTIGAVCERLREEFPDASISKIRYLEDQGLLRPRRTRGGYRLFSDDDVERLESTIEDGVAVITAEFVSGTDPDDSYDDVAAQVNRVRGDLPDGVVWLPGNSGSSTVRRTLGAGHGAVVTVTVADGGNA